MAYDNNASSGAHRAFAMSTNQSSESHLAASLRDQAAQRAALMLRQNHHAHQQQRPPPHQYHNGNSGSGYYDGESSRFDSASQGLLPSSPSHYLSSSAINWNSPPSAFATASHPNTVMHHHQTQVQPVSQTPDRATLAALTATADAKAARREWQLHGTGLTQVLQEQADQWSAARSSSSRTGLGGGGVVARVVSHVSRKDVAGSAFTAYVVYVTAPSGAAIAATAAAAPSPPSTCDASSQSSVSWYVERRYSDFHKLHARLMQCTAAGVTAAVPLSLSFANFPAKHWSSARWLRSLSSSTQTAKQTIEDRAVQLDVWLVNVVDAYNRGMLDGRPESSTSNSSGAHYCTSSCQQAIDEFLSPSLPPPCDRRGNPESDLPNRKKSFGAEDSLKFHNPWTTTMGSSLRQAVRTVEQLTLRENAVDASVPVDLLQCAQGLLFLTVAKAGLVVSGRVGTGLLVARRGVAPDVPCPAPGSSPGYGWSAPCAVSVVGVGWGALAGGDVTHYLIVLTTPKATQNLVANATLQVGAELGVAVGPVGRGANSHLQANGGWSVHAAYAYAVSRGLFIGMSLEGSVLRVRDDVNSVFYGKPGVTAAQILQSPGVKAAEPLYRAIDRALAMPIPEGAFRPSDYFAPSKGSQTYASRGVNQASVYSDSYSIYDINPRQDSNREDPSAFQSNGSHPSVMHSPSWASAAATRPW